MEALFLPFFFPSLFSSVCKNKEAALLIVQAPLENAPLMKKCRNVYPTLVLEGLSCDSPDGDGGHSGMLKPGWP